MKVGMAMGWLGMATGQVEKRKFCYAGWGGLESSGGLPHNRPALDLLPSLNAGNSVYAGFNIFFFKKKVHAAPV